MKRSRVFAFILVAPCTVILLAVPSVLSGPTVSYELSAEARLVTTISERIQLRIAYEEAAAKARLLSLSLDEQRTQLELEKISRQRTEAEALVKKKQASERTLTGLLRTSESSDMFARSVLVKRAEVATQERASAEEVLRALKANEQATTRHLQQVQAERASEEQKAKVEADKTNELKLALRSDVVKWQADPSPTNLINLKRTTLTIAAATGLSSTVNFTSEDTQKKETIGADAKYQSPEQRQFGANPKTAKCTTGPQCFDTVSPSYEYYVWAERAGKQTSDSNKKFPIANTEEKVTLVEDR